MALQRYPVSPKRDYAHQGLLFECTPDFARSEYTPSKVLSIFFGSMKPLKYRQRVQERRSMDGGGSVHIR